MMTGRGLGSIIIASIISASAAFPFPAKDAWGSLIETAEVSLSPQAVPAPAQPAGPDPGEYLKFAVKMKGAGKDQEAQRSLTEIIRFFPDTDWAQRASFVLGRIALEKNGPDSAELIENAAGLPDIGDYVTFYLAEAHSRRGGFIEAASAYDFIIASYPDSVLREKASYLKALSLFQAGDLSAAEDGFDEFLSAYPKSELAPAALLRSAEAMITLGKKNESIIPLKELATRYAASSEGGKAQSMLSSLEKEGIKGSALDSAERYSRAEAFFTAARYAKALVDYSALISLPEYRDRALFRTAVSEARLKRYDAAQKVLNDYLSLKDPGREAEALYWLALSSLRQGREEGLLYAEKRLSSKYPKSDERARTLLLLGKFYEDKSPEAAKNAYRAVLDSFAGSASSEEAFWNIAWGAYSSGRFVDAIDAFSSYLESRPAGKNAARAIYWKARSAERLGRADEARTVYKDICGAAEGSFYCLMAKRRLGHSAGGPIVQPNTADAQTISMESPFEQTTPQDEAAVRFSPDAHYRAATELMRLGLMKEAADEIDALARRFKGQKSPLAELAGLLYESNDFYRAFRIYRLHLSGSAGKELKSLGYPPKLVDRVREKAPSGSADPHLVAAVMREESCFNPAAVSQAGAMGLMQIMPSTGRQIAKTMGVWFASERLLEPDISISFGSLYLGQLLDRFHGDIALTIAAYNAGPNAVSKWMKSLPAETDEFVESIPYEETRNYVKRVLASYSEFLRFSGEDIHSADGAESLLPGAASGPASPLEGDKAGSISGT